MCCVRTAQDLWIKWPFCAKTQPPLLQGPSQVTFALRFSGSPEFSALASGHLYSSRQALWVPDLICCLHTWLCVVLDQRQMTWNPRTPTVNRNESVSFTGTFREDQSITPEGGSPWMKVCTSGGQSLGLGAAS